MRYVLTQHARDVVAAREIRQEWLQRVLESPERIHDDPMDSGLEHRLGKIADYGNRILRVVIVRGKEPVRVVTAYFDRKMKGTL